MKNSLNGRYHTRVVVNIIYSTVVACMVMVFLVTNLSMIGSMPQSVAWRTVWFSCFTVLHHDRAAVCALGDRSFFRQFSAAPEPFLRYISRISSAMQRDRRNEI